ncbi:flagellar biosynthetic protein FliP [Lysobacter pythonis]|uniref:Flagellar biosynthetic protein FliP n=1 Tax=Solilutibacter pythonis TaxID=2483112 RepID=A0A3M2I706_9GAMM|nr:flagellar type III secretion system pore protein FliP [Lysobacter pythonis]RMH94054.1 flagellar biosynthetic protein FliP [Lysobacter pythonis]
MNKILLIGVVLTLGFSSAVSASVPVDVLGEAVKQDYSGAMKTFVLLTLLSILPVLMICITSFTRIVIVLALLRHALGLPQTPPNSVIVALALCLTYFSMAPVLDTVNQNAVSPYLEDKITARQAVESGSEPIRSFMIRQTRESDLRAVLEMSRQEPPKTAADIKFSALIPAFLLSELKVAFQIGFVIFLPFLVIDLVVAAILMGLGMIMVPPASFSLPIKILLFVLIDGWVLVSKALLNSYWT